MLPASLGKVVHTDKRAGTYAAKVSPQELHKIAVHVRAVVLVYATAERAYTVHSPCFYSAPMYHRERILETSTLSCNEEEEEITKPPKR